MRLHLKEKITPTAVRTAPEPKYLLKSWKSRIFIYNVELSLLKM